MTGHKSAGLLLGIFVSVLLAGCVTAAAVKKPSVAIHKVALATFTVRNWGDMVSGTAGNAKATELINNMLAGLLVSTENKLAGVKHINKMSNFIDNPGYRSLNVKSEIDLMLPRVNGTPVVNFSRSEGDVVSANLTPEAAKKLCATLQVDAVVVVYSEWAWAVGHFVPTRRALAKDVVTVWDRNGNLVFSKRVDEQGEGVLGGPYGPIVVNEGTIKQWGGAYLKALDPIFAEMKATLK
jgi:hypothetical protein